MKSFKIKVKESYKKRREKMRKRLLLIMLLVLSFGLFACDQTTEPTKPSTGGTTPTETQPDPTPSATERDTIAPLLDVVPAEVNIEYNQDYDLMTGVSARDNIDGHITDQVEVDDGGFDNKVPGVYTITYSITDSSGNKTTKTRTITVAEMRTTIEIHGDQYPILYNPQLMTRGNSYYPFDLTRVTVFQQEYADWLYENNSQRFAAFWSIVLIVDAELNIVEIRDFNTNQFNADGVGPGVTWSTGTPTTANAEWAQVYGMLANMDVPKGGYVVVFINDGANGAGSPREFGSRTLLDGIGGLEAIGTKIALHNLPDDQDFNPDNTYPIIKLSEEVENTGLNAIKFDKGIDITAELGEDLLGGVTVWHETEENLEPILQELYYIDSNQDFIPITIAEIDSNSSHVYGAVYVVTDSKGNIETETRRFYFAGESEVPTEPDSNVAYRVFVGEESFPVGINDYDFSDSAGIGVVKDRALIYTKAYLESLENFDQPNEEGTEWPEGINYTLQYGFLVIVDAQGKVLQVILAHGEVVTWDETEEKIVMSEAGTVSATAQQIGILDRIPEGGYLYLFQNMGGDQEVRSFGYKHVVGFDAPADRELEDPFKVNPFADDFNIFYRLTGFDYVENFSFEGGFPDGEVLILSKDHLLTLENFDKPNAEGTEWPAGKTYTIGWRVMAVTDADGKVVRIRSSITGTDITWDSENDVMKGASWANIPESGQLGIMEHIPDGGYLYVFTGDTRDLGYQMLLGIRTVAGWEWDEGPRLITDATINPFDDEYALGKGTVSYGLPMPVEPTKPTEPTEPAVNHVLVNGETYPARKDDYNFDASGGIGAITDKAFVFSKAYLETFENFGEPNEGETAWPAGRNYTFQYSFVVIADADGKVVQIIRTSGDVLVWDSDAEEIKVLETIPNNLQHVGILDRIPEGGFVFLFQNSGAPNNAIRLFGELAFLGVPHASEDPFTVNPFADGFKVEYIVVD